MSKQVTGFKPGSKSWKKFMGKLYGIGAAVVIVGALFKIQHWPGAGPMLIAGLGTEAVIFFFSAFEPIHEDPDWTLVYPELATGDMVEHDEALPADASGSVTEQLDAMLEDAKIEPELIESLGKGMRSLSDQASKLSDMSDAAVATDSYVSSLKGASSRVSELSDTYAKASESLTGLVSVSEAGNSVGSSMEKMATNLSQLNNVYEMQLTGSQEHLEATRKMYEGISQLMGNLHDSLDDTRKYKENMAQLSQNLSALNTVYGNMLSAMGGQRGDNA